MTRRVLEVGNCEADRRTLQSFLERHFDVALHSAHDLPQTLEALRRQRFDLVLINRILDRDGTHGLQVIRAIRDDAPMSRQDIPLMLISNHADAQSAAVAAGAVAGFGKSQFTCDDTLTRLRPFLGSSPSTP